MPLSEACMAGIEKNGLRWKHEGPRIRRLATILGAFNDNGMDGDNDGDRLTRTAHGIAKNIRSWLAALPNTTAAEAIKEDFDHRHEDELQFLESINVVKETAMGIYSSHEEILEEVCGNLDMIYDSFDYHRIIIR